MMGKDEMMPNSFSEPFSSSLWLLFSNVSFFTFTFLVLLGQAKALSLLSTACYFSLQIHDLWSFFLRKVISGEWLPRSKERQVFSYMNIQFGPQCPFNEFQ